MISIVGKDEKNVVREGDEKYCWRKWWEILLEKVMKNTVRESDGKYR